MPPSAVLGRRGPLTTSNDFRGQNEYAYNLNEPNLEGVYEVKFLAEFSHFGVMLSQTCDKQRTIAFIYIDRGFVILENVNSDKILLGLSTINRLIVNGKNLID